MDPNATYQELCSLIKLFDKGNEIDINRLDELYLSLKTWIDNGGFKPKTQCMTLEEALGSALDILESTDENGDLFY